MDTWGSLDPTLRTMRINHITLRTKIRNNSVNILLFKVKQEQNVACDWTFVLFTGI